MAKLRCSVHQCDMIIFCPACRGSRKSVKKSRQSRINGLKGGRPRRNSL